MLHDHDYVTSTSSESPAPDPCIEIFSENKTANMRNQQVPFAAWLLVLLLALYTAQTNNSGNVLCEIFQLYTRQQIVNRKRGKPYSRAVMIFCLTLAGYSVRAYKFLRTTVANCLPCIRTLRRCRHRADGSPGFSSSALQMIKNKVSEMSAASKKLFVQSIL